MNMRKTMAAIFLSFASLTTTVQADYWSSCSTCCPDITVGVDWLYWTPCIHDQHFAVTSTETTIGGTAVTNAKTHYLCDEWDSGARVYARLGNCWNGFNGALIYTYINPKTSGKVEGDSSVLFSAATPQLPVGATGSSLFSKWELEYQTLDAVLSYSIDVTQNRCLKIEAFSGLTWIDVTQDSDSDLVDSVTNQGTTTTVTTSFDRHNDFWAIGPCFGVNTSLRICDCFNIFGMIKTSLVVGESDSKDAISQVEVQTPDGGQPGDPNTLSTRNYKAKDECFCFPGLHLATGIEYELCLCDTTFGIRLGWEYVQWINAPTFPHYELDGLGVRSAPSTNDLTMQGIFLGLNATF